jgi:hypothetical protein
MGAWAGFACGIVLLLGTGSSVVKMLLIPRNLGSLISGAISRLVLSTYRLITARIADLYRREQILASGAPAFLFSVLVAWIACLYVAYSLILLPFTSNLTQAMRLSGSSLFTLGFTVPAGAAPYGIVFAAAISGLGVIALMIGYMPTIYSAYNRREVQVMQLSLCPGSAPSEARPLLRVGYVTMRQIASTLGLPVNEDPHPDDPIALTRAEFDEAVAHMDEAGWVFERTPDEAWLHFRGWRVNYELAGYGIAAYLDLPKAMWSGPRRRSGREMAPARPAHREPAAGQKGSPQRDGSAARTIPLSTCANT